MDERVTPSFWLSEFLNSDIAVRNGIDNTPSATQMANIKLILIPGMQRIRELLGVPVIVTSGLRVQALDRFLKRKPPEWISGSQHTEGLAADWRAPQFGTPREISHYLLEHKNETDFDQLIFEGSWVHTSFTRQPRGQVLTAHFDTAGNATYTAGLA